MIATSRLRKRKKEKWTNRKANQGIGTKHVNMNGKRVQIRNEFRKLKLGGKTGRRFNYHNMSYQNHFSHFSVLIFITT